MRRESEKNGANRYIGFIRDSGVVFFVNIDTGKYKYKLSNNDTVIKVLNISLA